MGLPQSWLNISRGSLIAFREKVHPDTGALSVVAPSWAGGMKSQNTIQAEEPSHGYLVMPRITPLTDNYLTIFDDATTAD